MTLPRVGDWNPAHLSYSTVDGYRTCGMRLKLQKIQRVEQRPGLAAIGGNAVHVASEHVDFYILEHGFDDDPEVVEPDVAPF